MKHAPIHQNDCCMSHWWNRFFVPIAGGLLLVGLAVAGIPARADEEGEVAVGGEHILTIRFPAAGMSVKRRADAITDRLRIVLADPALKPSDIVAVPLGKNAAKIMVKHRLLVTIEPEAARFNQCKPLALAQVWVDHLRRVLPEVNVSPNLNLHKEETGQSAR